MDVGELFRLLLRRWAVAAPALILTVLATAGAYVSVPTQYQSQVQLTMFNASKITDEPGNYGNPFLAFDTTLSVDVDYLTRYLTADSSVRQLKAMGVTEQFTAAFANNALGPFMVLTVTGPHPAHIRQSIAALVRFTENRWIAIQQASSAPTNSIVKMSVIAPPSAPAPVLKQKIEVVSGVLILGIVFSILLAVMVDSSIRRRRSRLPEMPARRSEWPAEAVSAAPATAAAGRSPALSPDRPLSRRPEPDRSRRPEPERDRRPEPDRDRRPEPERDRRPEPDRDRRPEPERDRRPEPERDRRPEPDPSRAPM